MTEKDKKRRTELLRTLASTSSCQGHQRRILSFLSVSRKAKKKKKKKRKKRRQLSFRLVRRIRTARDVFSPHSPLNTVSRVFRRRIVLREIMSSKSSASSGLRQAFDKYSKFGKTQAQLADHNELRIGSAGIQKNDERLFVDRWQIYVTIIGQ